MHFQAKTFNSKRIFLLAGLGLLLCTFCGALWGCGSQDSRPVSQQKERTTKHDQLRIVEILPKPHKGEAISPQVLLKGPPDRDLAEVIPPGRRGGHGVNLRDIKARRTGMAEVDPQNVEVVPPGKPGKRGMTLGAINALTPSAAECGKVDPQLIEVIPPPQPGGHGMTLGAVNALKTGLPQASPDFPRGPPPSGPAANESLK